MFIRRTTIKSRRDAQAYYTYRLVESVRTEQGVRQRTLLNLGRHFDVPRAQWAPLAQRIEQLLSGQGELIEVPLDAKWETTAQRLSALLIHSKARVKEGQPPHAVDYQLVDLNTLDMVRPRSVSIEHVAWETARQVGLDTALEGLALTRPQRAAAIATIIGRMIAPGSELSTHAWLREHSALGELIEYDFGAMSLMQLYRVSDLLWKHKEALEHLLYTRERSLFDLDEVITLYDLTNTYFEGNALSPSLTTCTIKGGKLR